MELNQTKINPGLLRLFVIFPNVLSYCLLVGIIFYVLTNFEELKLVGALNFWLILIVVLLPTTLFTTYSIIKRIRAGVL